VLNMACIVIALYVSDMQLLVRIHDSSYAMRKQYSKSKGRDPHPTVTSYQVFILCSYPLTGILASTPVHIMFPCFLNLGSA
jgi:hypothetical protein